MHTLENHINKGNINRWPDGLDFSAEQFDNLFESGNIRIERVLSHGQASPPDFWYEQQEDEWVLLIQGNAHLEVEGQDMIDLIPGDHIHIPAGIRHRVHQTSKDPPCLWLAVFVRSEHL